MGQRRARQVLLNAAAGRVNAAWHIHVFLLVSNVSVWHASVGMGPRYGASVSGRERYTPSSLVTRVCAACPESWKLARRVPSDEATRLRLARLCRVSCVSCRDPDFRTGFAGLPTSACQHSQHMHQASVQARHLVLLSQRTSPAPCRYNCYCQVGVLVYPGRACFSPTDAFISEATHFSSAIVQSCNRQPRHAYPTVLRVLRVRCVRRRSPWPSVGPHVPWGSVRRTSVPHGSPADRSTFS